MHDDVPHQTLDPPPPPRECDMVILGGEGISRPHYPHNPGSLTNSDYLREGMACTCSTTYICIIRLIKNARHPHLFIFLQYMWPRSAIFCDYSTVIYTSIAVLHWEFRTNWKVSRRLRTSGGGYPKCIKNQLIMCAHSCLAALPRFAVETIHVCGQYAENRGP